MTKVSIILSNGNVFDNIGYRPNKCKHNFGLADKKIDHFRTEFYCLACGEQVGWVEDLTQDPSLFVGGKVRKLTAKEKKELR